MDSANLPAQIVGIGAATLDCLTLGTVPAPGGVAEAQEIVFAGGGPVATALVAASRLGIRTHLIDSFADDAPGRIILEGLRSEGVTCTHLRPALRSAVATIAICPTTAERSIAFRPADAPTLTLTPEDKAAIRSASILHLNGRHLKAATAAVEIAREAGTRVSFDGGAGRYHSALRSLTKSADILIVSEEYWSAFTGNDFHSSGTIAPTADAADLSAEIIVITCGSRGSVGTIRENGQTHQFYQPAYPIKSIVDTTGCGDCYHGVFLASLLSGNSAVECAREASAAAALVATALGGRNGLPRRANLETFLSSHEEKGPLQDPPRGAR